MSTRPSPRVIALFVALVMGIMCLPPSTAYAYNDDLVNLWFGFYEGGTQLSRNNEITVAAIKKDSNYIYEKRLDTGYCDVRYTTSAYSPNAFVGHTKGSDNQVLLNMFMPGSPLSTWKDKHIYQMALNPPAEYMTPPAFTVKIGSKSAFGGKPVIEFGSAATSNVYFTAIPQVSVGNKMVNWDIRRLRYNEWRVSANFFLRRKQVKSLKLEVPSALVSNGYTFSLEPTGSTPGSSIPFEGSGGELVAKPRGSNNVVVGTYDLIVKDSSGAERRRYAVSINPLRIPRDISGLTASYLRTNNVALPLKPINSWMSADPSITLTDMRRMESALASLGLGVPNGNGVYLYSDRVAAIENYWTKIQLPAGSTELTEKEPTSSAAALTDHVLKLNFSELTVKKAWKGNSTPDQVTITCNGGDDGSTELNLSSSNNWQQRVNAKADAVLTFTENVADGYSPTEWRLAKSNASQGSGIKLPMSKDGKTAKLDLQNGTGMENGDELSRSDLQKAKELVATGDAVLTVTNAKTKTFSVEKQWVIDALSQDRPATIRVALQKKDDGKKEWKNVETIDLSSANSWKADFKPVPDEGSNTNKMYRVRELSEDGKTVWAKGDPDVPETKSLLGRLTDWDQLWQQDDLTEYLKGNVKTTYEPTVVYSVSGVQVSTSGVSGPHKTKYYATYSTSGETTTITNTAVLDVSIYKRWLMFGSSKKPESVNLMLFGRDKVIGGSAADAGAARPYLPVTNALYGDAMKASDIADLVGLKGVLTKIPGITEEKINQWIKVGLAVGKAKANDKNALTGWRVKFGVKKYSNTGTEQEYLGAELVTGLIKIGTDTLTGYSFPAMLQPLSPRYLTVYGKAYQVPVICKDYERTANVVNTWLSISSDPQVAIGGTKHWEGDEAKDRPKEVTLHIYQKIRDKDGNIEKDITGKDKKKECKGSPIKIKASDNWVWSFAIAKEKNQNEKQAVKQEDLSIEEEVPQGYSVRYEGYDIFNKKDGSQTTTVKGAKTWDDNNDAQKKRPSSITIRLYEKVKDSEGEPTEKESRTVNADAGWKWAFNNLPKTKKVDGKDKEITYTIKEDKVEGYETKVNGYNVTNTLKQSGITVEVTKQWQGAPSDYKYPASITVRLYEKVVGSTDEPTEKEKRSVTKSEDGTWKCTFTGLPTTKKVDGVDKDIEYTVKEDAVPDFATEVSGLQVEGNTRKYTITNTYTNKTSVHVEKEWDNEHDNTGNLTPDKVTVRLYADGTEASNKTPLELNAKNNWHGDFTDLDKTKKVDGKDRQIVYTVKEDPVTNWKPFVDGNAQDGFTITNVYDPEAMDLTVKVEWDDYDNKDRIRPSKVQAYLIADGKVVLDDKNPRIPKYLDLEAKNGWTAMFTNLPVRSADDGHEISYRVRAQRTPPLGGNGYTNSYAVSENHSSIDDGYVFITCRHTPDKYEIHGTKVWDDEGNESNRPEKIKLKLLTDGTVLDEAKDVIELTGWDLPNEDGGIPWTFGDRPVYRIDEFGQQRPIYYNVVEEPVKDYRTTFDGDLRAGFTITNTYDPATTNVTVIALWDDQNDLDGLRPKTVNVLLMSEDGKVISNKPLVLTAQGNWMGTFEDLPAYDGDGVTPVNYKVHVQRTDVIGGETKLYQVYELEKGMAKDGVAVVKLVHVPQTTSVTVIKHWEHENAPDEAKPENVTVRLYGNGQELQVMNIGKTTPEGEPEPGEDWSYTFSNLRVLDTEGNRIFYTVSEDPVNDYTATYDHIYTEEKNEYTITNTYDPTNTSLTVSALIDDQNDLDRIRPKELKVLLLADGQVVKGDNNQPVSVTLNAQNGWTQTFVNLPRRDSNQEGIVYRAWVPRNSREGIGPKDGPGTYAVWEENYGTLAFVNLKHTPQTVDIVGTKVWDDEDDHDGVRPEAIVIKLLANGEVIDRTVVTSASSDGNDENLWDWAFEDKPMYQPGVADDPQRIIYTVEEERDPEWDEDLAKNYPQYSCEGNAEKGFTIINGRTLNPTKLLVNAMWEDQSNKDGIRPKSITVQLLANGEEILTSKYPTTLTLDEENAWAGLFDNLPSTDFEGNAITYSAVVVRDDEAGIGPVDGPGTYGVNEESKGDLASITLTHTPQRADIGGVKLWDDENNKDGVRPESITVRLLADGTEVDQATVTAATANADDQWEWEFADRPAYRGAGTNVKAIDYSVQEDAVASYTSAVVHHEGNDWTLINSHAAKPTTVRVRSVWIDNNDSMGLRPTATGVRLMASTAVEGDEIEMVMDEKSTTADGDWVCTFDDVALTVFGEKLNYSVESDEVQGYEITVTGDVQNGFVVTYTITDHPELTSVAGQKHWIDDDNAFGQRPDSITVYLMANNTMIDSKTVSEQDGWAWDFTDLPARSNNENILYAVLEGKVNNYDVDRSDYDITNSIDPAFMRTSVKVSKTWEGDEEAPEKRPGEITVYLLADGAIEKSQTVSPNEQGEWTVTFDDLPLFDVDYEVIDYTVLEKNVPGYTASIEDNLDETFAITNVLDNEEPGEETTTVTGTKTWADNDDEAGMRPKSITVYLVANDAEVMDEQEVTADDGWQWEFIGLPTKIGDEEISYRVVEQGIEGYEATYDGPNITNTPEKAPEPTTVTIEGSKTWEDYDNAFNTRPESITVFLVADGSEVVDIQEVTAEDDWKWTFENQPAAESGVDVTYSVVEAPVEGYLATVDGYNITNTIARELLPARHDPPVQKKIVGDSPANDSTFTFVLSPTDESYPMPDGKVGGTKEVTIVGEGSAEFGIIVFDEAGTYDYTVTEKDTGETGYTYDSATYTIRYEVSDTDEDGDRCRDCTRTFLKDGEIVGGMESAAFTNTYQAPAEPETPPAPAAPAAPASTRAPVPNTADTSVAVSTLASVAGILITIGYRKRKIK